MKAFFTEVEWVLFYKSVTEGFGNLTKILYEPSIETKKLLTPFMSQGGGSDYAIRLVLVLMNPCSIIKRSGNWFRSKHTSVIKNI